VKEKLLLLTIFVLALASFASADTFAIYGSRAAQPISDIFDWGQIAPPGTDVSTPQFVFSFLGTNAALVGNVDGSDFVTAQQGSTWNGNFSSGENLIWTGNAALFGVGGEGPMAMVFLNPVGTVGFSIQADLYGAFTAYLAAFDSGGNPLFSYSANGVSNGNGDGSALFMGLGDLTGANIASIEFTVASNVLPPYSDNDFAIDDVSIGSTPEPSSLVLLGSGLIGLAGVTRRKLGR
jgi:hypothetical protein